MDGLRSKIKPIWKEATKRMERNDRREKEWKNNEIEIETETETETGRHIKSRSNLLSFQFVHKINC